MQTFTLFVRSTGGAHGERQAAGRVVDRLQERHAGRIRLEIVAEDEPPANGDLDIRIPGAGDAVVLCYRRARGVEAGPARKAGRRKKGKAARKAPEATALPSYRSVPEFEALLEKDLESLVRHHLGSPTPVPDRGSAGAVSPFMGLRAFGFQDAGHFRGRERQAAEALAMLEANRAAGNALLLIRGPAGAGKSSLMQAGLAPALTAPAGQDAGTWAGTCLRPCEGGASPLETLAGALEEALPDLAKLRDTSGKENPPPVWNRERLARAMGTRERLPYAVAAVMAALDRMSAGRPARLLILLDRLEELFTTPGVTEEMRGTCFRALLALAATRHTRVIATFREDFSRRLVDYPDFHLIAERGSYRLEAPEADELGRMIREPAAAAGLEYEGDLADRILAEAGKIPDPLPLLGFTLQELYLRRRGHLLSRTAYKELGGVEEAIPRRAEAVWESLPAETRREAAGAVFRELVQPGPVPASRSAPRQRLDGAHPAARAFVDAFLAAGLLTVENEGPDVRLAHEVLFTRWPHLEEWLAVAKGKPAPAVPAGEELRRERRMRRIYQGIAAGCAGLALAAGIAASDNRKAPAPASTVHEPAPHSPELAAADFEAGAAHLEAGAPDKALPFLIAALENEPRHADAQALLLGALRSTGWHFPAGEIRHPLPVTGLAFAGDGTLHAAIGSGDDLRTILKWDLWNGALDAVLKPEKGKETRILGVAPGGRRALIRRGKEVLLYDGGNLKPLKGLPLMDSAAPECVTWSGEGALLAYPAEAEEGISWIIADAASGETIRQSAEIAAVPLAARLDRERLRAVHADGMVAELPLSPARPMRKGLPPEPERLAAAIMSPDGGEVLARRTPGGKIVRFRLHEEGTPGLLQVSPADPAPGREWPGADSLPEERPWNREFPPAWASLSAAEPEASFPTVKGTSAHRFHAGGSRFLPAAPLVGDSRVNAVATTDSLVAVGTGNGLVTLHRALPRLGFALEAIPAAGMDGWRLFKNLGRNGSAEIRDGEIRLRAGEDTRPLAIPPAWEEVRDLAFSEDGKRMILTGPDEIQVRETETGKTIAGPEPMAEPGHAAFLDGDRRLAIACRSAVLVFDAAGSGLLKVAEIPLSGATGLYAPPHSGWFAISTPETVLIHSKEDFSRIAALPATPGKACCWAEDGESGWLARASDRVLELWSVKSGRRLIAALPLGEGGATLAFESRDGFRGLKLEGANRGFIPLAKDGGLTPREIKHLRDFSRGLGGMDFARDTRKLQDLSLEERRKALGRLTRGLAEIFPGADPLPVRDAALAIPYRVPEAAAWTPLWKRFFERDRADPPGLAGLVASSGGEGLARQYLLGQIGATDAELFRLWRGASDAAPVPDARELTRLYRHAGETAEISGLKLASWQAAGDAPGGKAAITRLDEAVKATLAAFERDPTPRNALVHTEALALRGDFAHATEFLRGKIPADSPLSLRQAHFLLSAGLETEAEAAVKKALPGHASPWLWRQWLRNRAADGGELLPALESALVAVEGRGPAAVEALRLALASENPACIAACLKRAKGLPDSLRKYATGAALWAEGEKARAFGLWPEEFPDLAEEISRSDWSGWESALPAGAVLFSEMRDDLTAIEPGPNAEIGDLQSIAALLLAPEALATYGARRVRDAMARTAAELAHDKDSRELVEKLVERARLAGASHAECLRIEARVFMAAGEFTAAYARWIELIDSGDAGIGSGDYLEAARCVIEDMQDAAAIALLMRGKERYPADPAYAYDAAWLLLSTSHPEEAGVLLEHGFAIPFGKDQREVALAMLVCAAEQTLRPERADQAFAELSGLSAEWGSEDSLKSLGWPEALEQTLIAVAERNR